MSEFVKLRIVHPEVEIPNTETGIVVTGKDILKQMKINNVWKFDHVGKYCEVQYDRRGYVFREGQTVTVSEHIGRRLRACSAIIVGNDSLNGPIVPFLEVCGEFSMVASEDAKPKTATSCPICGEDQNSFPGLSRHMALEKKKHPELFQEEPAKPADKYAMPTEPADGE